MNKVIQVNLGGIAFTFDDDAYELLDDYLDSLNGYFRGTPGCEDIMHDIEARLSELFTQNLKGRSIVTASDVNAATATLGSVKQLSGDAIDPEPSATTSKDDSRHGRNTKHRSYSRYGKKLMRDPDDKRVGGVCAGFAAYFGIENPAWIRLALIISLFPTGGASLVAYIVLWAVLPLAYTAGDKLAMRGEPVDLQNIANEVEREAKAIANRLQDWGDDINRRSNKWSKRPPRNSREHRKQRCREEFME